MQKRCTRVKMHSRRSACLFGREEINNYTLYDSIRIQLPKYYIHDTPLAGTLRRDKENKVKVWQEEYQDWGLFDRSLVPCDTLYTPIDLQPLLNLSLALSPYDMKHPISVARGLSVYNLEPHLLLIEKRNCTVIIVYFISPFLSALQSEFHVIDSVPIWELITYRANSPPKYQNHFRNLVSSSRNTSPPTPIPCLVMTLFSSSACFEPPSQMWTA